MPAGYYIDPQTGEPVALPCGYAPNAENAWVPAKSGDKNWWIDPAMGLPLDQKAPFVLIYDDGKAVDDKTANGLEVFRAERPPTNVANFITILKVATNAKMADLNPTTVAQAWASMKEAIKHSCNVEKMVWQKLGESKFGFQTRDIYKMDRWKRKSTFRITATDDEGVLGINEARIRSEYVQTGYDLSKIKGYDHSKVIGPKAWSKIKYILLKMMQVEDLKQVERQVKKHNQLDARRALSTAQMKILEKAAEGKDPFV